MSQVRQFRARMVKDHANANSQLKKLALSRGIKLSEELDAEHPQTLEKLKSMSGAKFDAEYARVQESDHEKAIALCKRQAESGSDMVLKQLAVSTLPMLEAHKKKVDAMR